MDKTTVDLRVPDPVQDARDKLLEQVANHVAFLVGSGFNGRLKHAVVDLRRLTGRDLKTGERK